MSPTKLIQKKSLTPMRSPPPRGRRGGGDNRRNPSLPATATMTNKSSSEKETPTIVLTALTKNISPFASSTYCDNQSSSNIGGGRRRIAVHVHGPRKREREGATQETTRSTRKRRDDNLSEESLGGGDAHAKEKFCDDSSEGSLSSSGAEDDDDYVNNIYDNEGAVNAVLSVVSYGIASICRLRKLFPLSFFQKFDLGDGTTITRFNEEGIEEQLRKSLDITYDEEEEDNNDEEEDDSEQYSMMKSISTKRSATQKTVSPLTGASQWPAATQCDASSQRGNDKSFGCNNAEGRSERQTLAMEALQLVQWMRTTDSLFRGGKLARIVFGICVGDELIESYSFQLSFAKQSHPSELQMTQVLESAGSFFRNLNGYSAGMPLSQTLMPNKTQSSFPTQGYSQASSQYCTQQNFAFSQNYNTSQLLEMTQKHLMMSMSQSINASVKKNCGYQIPDSRYLSLSVKFTDEMQLDHLPEVFQVDENNASPYPAEGDMDRFVITPLGSISESCLAGLKVEIHAYSKGQNEDEDERSIYFSQHSPESRPEPESNGDRHSSSTDSASSASEDLVELAYAIPFGLTGKIVYLPCTLLGQKRESGHEKFKVRFDNEQLTLKKMEKQWVLSKNVLSFAEVHKQIKQDLKARCFGKNGKGRNVTSLVVADIAEALKVQVEVVRFVAEKAGIKVRDVEGRRHKK